MGGCHKVDVVHTGIGKSEEYIAEFFRSDGLSGSLAAYLAVLAVYTAQIASREENGSGTPASADAGLLPEMRRCPDDRWKRIASAVSVSFLRIAYNSALSCTVTADIFKCLCKIAHYY